jgi:DNA modification methylase
MIIEKKKIADLIPAPYNPRQSTAKQEKHLKESLEKFGLVEPIIFNKQTGYIVGGHFRVRELKKLGITEIECVIVDLNEADEKELNIRLNANTGSWDWDTLANDWDVVNLEAWGLEIPQFDNVPEELEASEDDYDVPEGGLETDIVIGDLFEIGEHRLLCGDSTDSDAVARLMNGEKADMVFTDPPYGIDVVKNSTFGGDKEATFQGVVGGGGGATKKGKNKIVDAKVYEKIIGDNTTETAKEFYQTCISLGMKNFIIWGGNYFTDFLPVSACWVIWDKENSGNFADVEIAWTSFDKGSKLYKWMWNGMSRKGSRELEGKTRVHPTQKPVGLFGDIFNDFPFQICFDGFLGSGSTMVAAHQLKRRCYGMELEPKYCQVIIDRMRKLDSSLIIKRNGMELKQA